MEVLQCDGCDFRAPSYEDLKAHIQDVHTAFLQPTDVAEDNANEPRSGSMNASNQTEMEFSSIKDEFAIAEDLSGQNATALGTGSYYGHSPGYYGQHIAPNPKPTNKFFQCKFCVRYFRSKNLLIEHTRKVHGAQAEGSSVGPPVPGSLNYNIMMHEGFGKVFSCQFCTYKSPRRARIIKHQKMYHKNNLKETTAPPPAPAPVPDPVVPPVSLQDPCKELPAEVVERSILESMVKPLTKSRGNFCCEWCSYQTPRRERWCDHMMKKHRSMVKILSSLRQQQEGTNLPDVQNKNAPSPPSNSTYLSMNTASREMPSTNVSNYRSSVGNSIMRPNSSSASKFSPMSYPQMKPKSPHNSGLVNLAERSRYGMTDMSSSPADLETNSMLNDSSSDEELNEIDSENGLNAMDHQTAGMSAEQLMGSDGNKLLETKGIPFRRFMNRFQCPFCPFLTMHRRSISRHIENIHLSGKTAVYKSPPLHPYKCTMCSYSTTTLKGLRVHQQHKHSFCDNLPKFEGQPSSLPLESETDSHPSSSNTVKKSQTSILGLSSKNNFVAKAARKLANDFPLDLSPVKKRTRIDEIASNLQSKINQTKQQEDAVINVEDDEEEEEDHEVEIEVELDREEEPTETIMEGPTPFSAQQIWARDAPDPQKEPSFRTVTHDYNATNGAEIELTLSEDEEDYYGSSTNVKDHQVSSTALLSTPTPIYGTEHNNENTDFSDSGRLYYCKHCDFNNKSARSVSTHYQRMHPYIKFSFRYILDPNDHSAVYRCLECYIDYTNFEDLQQHYGEHHPEAMNVLNFDHSDLIYRCRFCSYTSPNVRSLMPHYQRMHPTVKINNAMIFSSYVVEQQEGLNTESQTLREILNSAPKSMATSTPVARGGGLPAPFSKNTPSKTFPPECENQKDPSVNTVVVYDCDVCSFASPNMHSVLVHYQKKHPEEKASYFRIQKTMRMVSVDRGSALSQLSFELNRSGSERDGPPVENEMFFCQHCDYGNRTVKGVLIHYQKKHRDFKANADVIRQHTATIRSLCDRNQKKPASCVLMPPSNVERDKTKLRALKCRQCSYTSPYFYALRKHIKKDHPALKATVTSIMRWAFLDGLIDAGYHCEWCIYSHTEPSGLLLHYQRRHPEHYVDYTYMATKLWAGPDPSPPSLTMTAEAKTYRCRDCVFEAVSIWDITNHYQAFHPWAMNGDESVLLDIIKEKDAVENPLSASEELVGPVNCENSMPAPLPEQEAECPEDARLSPEKSIQLASANPAISSTPYQCTVCQSEYNNLHGLLTHYGKKHPGMKVKAADFAQDIDINPGAVYKCRHCPYINTRIHGVLTHYQKRHPAIKVTAEDFVHDVEQPADIAQNDVEETSRIFKQGYGAYRCKLCPYTHGTLEKLKIHYEKYHNQPEFDVFSQSPPKLPVSLEPEITTEVSPSQVSVTEEELCKYFCSTRKGIARHYRIKHNNVRAQPEGKNNLFKCALCAYTNPIRKGLAAHYQKRHDIDAYYTHCLAASRTISDKPNKSCSKKGIVSHYMKRHPGVFPKKQHASKLGGYFTAVYADEHEKPVLMEEEERGSFEKAEVEGSEAELLCMHYTDHHSRDLKRDFVILGGGPRPQSSTYQCKHCDSKLQSTAELTSHLNVHNEEFQKRAKHFKQERPFGHLEEVPKIKERKVVGYKCKFCVEVHPTLRAICNHLRKHVQYGSVPAVSATVKEAEDPSHLFLDGLEAAKDASGALVARVDGEHCLLDGMVEDETRPGGYHCSQCDRVLMSMQGLRSHERSHLALAMFTREDKYSCQYCSFVSAFRHNLDRHMQTHHGHHKPFRCKLCSFKSSYNSRLKTHILKAHAGEHAYKCSWCSFSTMTISQLKEHSLKVHGKALTLPRPRIVSLLSSHAHHTSQKATPAEEVEDSNDSSYSEPPDVQQQLNHYQSAALARNNSRVSPVPLSGASGGAEQKTEAVLHCEFCEFSSGYIQSIRRHYRDKHGGKKLFKCKDCSFYTGFKSAFTMHVEAGHSAVPEEGPKDLRCPLCLYHTKYKRNMIDHIVLHREERVVPIEVCRSKLSKYLQGVVFRCDKCTFTCSSDESLQQHIEKHNELKPYKCQLCYYETKHTEELDSHLRDEHKVSRNFELVGRVNLDQLEQMKEKMESSSSDEDDKEEEMNSKVDDRDLMRFSDRGAAVSTEKRFPCEFCGRAFSQGSEWERHVLRHGMALNDTKQVSREEIHLKETMEDSIKMPSIEEKDDDESMGIDFSLKTETVAICVVAADESLLENAEAKKE
ncbi:zinc finger protein 462-like protein [Camelus ferus]|nr:zinc finger protein 462-like protein [Camelus ferus]